MTARTDTSRSLLHWALQELAGYALAALAGVLAFTVGAVIYTYVFYVPKSASIETPQQPPPVIISPETEASPPPGTIPAAQLPATAPMVQIPGDRLPELPIASYVYNENSDKVGKIAAVLLGNDRKVDFYILAVGDWFLDGSEKVIAVPSQKMTWVKGYSTKQDEWTAVVSMTKADMQNAPKQTFDFDAKKWVPAQ